MSATPQVILFDIGGVLASNGWDRPARTRAADHFEFDWAEFQDRHDFVAHEFETGRLTRSDYLERTLFYRDRAFSTAEFVEFMEAQTEPYAASLDIVAEVAATGERTLATLNNESRELNEYRIETLDLRSYFAMFLSSCYLGFSKPEPEIYRLAIDITQREPEQCLFIDDRELNIECAQLEGMQTHLFRGAADLREALRATGVLG